MKEMKTDDRHHVVVIGGGFGGLYAAKTLARAPVRVTLVDKRNFHLFQPLLYQVATGGLSPGDIASPLRSILSAKKNVEVIQGTAVDIDPDKKAVFLDCGEIVYDSLIVATGAGHHYFGREDWREKAPGLKSIEDALDIRQRVFNAFEQAEKETNPEKRKALMTFIVVGGGPTGVELAGALAELAHQTLKNDFRRIDPTETRIFLIEGGETILGTYDNSLSAKAAGSLHKLGVTVETGSIVTEIDDTSVTVKAGQRIYKLLSNTILWAAGVNASEFGETVARRTGAAMDGAGRVKVTEHLTVPGYDDLLVIGDLMYLEQDGEPLPGVATVAMQQGRYAARSILSRIKGVEEMKRFAFRNKGSMAVIGRNAAVAQFGSLKVSGFWAWLMWIFIHIAYLIEFDNKLTVLIQWAGDYFTRKRGARLITHINEKQVPENKTTTGEMVNQP
jgi:NADH dehydrogenase